MVLLNDRDLADYQVHPLISLNRLQIHNSIWYIQSGRKDILYSSISHHTLHWDSTDYYGIMARTDWNFSFSVSYQMKFKATIRGHHVYKVTWSPVMNEVLICKKDNREEAHEYDSNAVGVYKDIAEWDNLELAGHVPVELSRVLAVFFSLKRVELSRCTSMRKTKM